MSRILGAHRPPPAHARTPAEELHAINRGIKERGLTLGEMMHALRDRAYSLFVFLIALPFCTPIPMLGISIPFGIVIAYLGIRLALGMEPRIPGRFRDRPVSRRTLAPILRAAERLLRGMERFMRPRHEFLTRSWPARTAIGTIIAACGILLMLPLPVPTSNFFPAVTIVCLAAALTEDDGVVAIAGLFLFALTLAFFAVIAFFGTGILESLWNWAAG